MHPIPFYILATVSAILSLFHDTMMDKDIDYLIATIWGAISFVSFAVAFAIELGNTNKK